MYRGRSPHLLTALFVAAGAAVLAVAQRQKAQDRARRAVSQRLASRSSGAEIAGNPVHALRDAIAAGRTATPEAEDALRYALSQYPLALVIGGPDENIQAAAASPDGTRIVAGSDRSGRCSVERWRSRHGER